MKQHNSSVWAPPGLVTAHRVIRDGHPRHTADPHSPIHLNQDGPSPPFPGLRHTPSMVGGLWGAARAGDTDDQHKAVGDECARPWSEQQRGSAALRYPVPVPWCQGHSWMLVPMAKAP